MAEPTSAERAALAFSLIRAEDATAVSDRLSIAERMRLREGLSQVRNAPTEARVAALQRLIAAVRAGTVFPPPMGHDEGTCPFHRMERFPNDLLVMVLQRFASSDPLLTAVALCHFSLDVRDLMWSAFPARTRATLQRSLGQVPNVTHARTRRYAIELDSALRRAARRGAQ
jgi:hypothetical protein